MRSVSPHAKGGKVARGSSPAALPPENLPKRDAAIPQHQRVRIRKLELFDTTWNDDRAILV